MSYIYKKRKKERDKKIKNGIDKGKKIWYNYPVSKGELYPFAFFGAKKAKDLPEVSRLKQYNKSIEAIGMRGKTTCRRGASRNECLGGTGEGKESAAWKVS